MDYDQKKKIIKHITLGTEEVLYYPYNFGKEILPLRPLSSFELDQCFYNSLNVCSNYKVASFVVKYRVWLIKGTDEIDISNEGYMDLLKFYNEVDMWIVYYSMKKFQNDEFSKINFSTGKPNGISIVEEMIEVHEIADFILSASIKSEDVIKEIFEDSLGREIAEVVYYLKIPLSDFSKITKLQRSYLIYAKGNLEKLTKNEIESKYIRSGQVMTYKEFLERFK